MPFYSTKTWSHSLGLSACYRQWRADSHCRFIHGYALEVKVTFGADKLDHRYWVQDFGGLKAVKDFLCEHFDHKLLVARDDPQRDLLQSLELLKSQHAVAEVVLMEHVGCEAFAEYIYVWIDSWVRNETKGRVWCHSVEVREHGGNSAIYEHGGPA